eukprot:2420560-Pleurochrysis_carterae.AAC.5
MAHSSCARDGMRLGWEWVESRWSRVFVRAPGNLEGLEDGTVLVGALVDELALELVEEFEVEVVLLRERLLADDGLHRHHVLANGVVGVQLRAEAIGDK